jgi:hypothetical protein
VRIGTARRVLIQTVSSAARFNPLIHDLRRATDPLFRPAGMDLDGEGRK